MDGGPGRRHSRRKCESLLGGYRATWRQSMTGAGQGGNGHLRVLSCVDLVWSVTRKKAAAKVQALVKPYTQE